MGAPSAARHRRRGAFRGKSGVDVHGHEDLVRCRQVQGDGDAHRVQRPEGARAPGRVELIGTQSGTMCFAQLEEQRHSSRTE